MTIIKQSRPDLTPAELYKLTKNQSIAKMSTAPDNEPLAVGDWVMFEDLEQKTGEVQTILSITLGGVVYATNSPTFTREFRDIAELFNGAEIPPIIKITGKSKAGRMFITCALC